MINNPNVMPSGGGNLHTTANGSFDAVSAVIAVGWQVLIVFSYATSGGITYKSLYPSESFEGEDNRGTVFSIQLLDNGGEITIHSECNSFNPPHIDYVCLSEQGRSF